MEANNDNNNDNGNNNNTNNNNWKNLKKIKIDLFLCEGSKYLLRFF